MSKQSKRTLIGCVAAVAVLLAVSFLPPETEEMGRIGWKYLGCFSFMLVLVIGSFIPDWAAVFATMGMLAVMKVGTIAQITAQFSVSTVWLCISIFVMSVGINNSGVMKRLALWILTKFPGSYRWQVVAMMLSGLITTPCIPSSYAKTAMMAPFTAQISEAVGVEPRSKQATGLWYASFMGTYALGMAFVSGSAHVALMMGFIGTAFSWGQWFSMTWLWYVISIVLTFVYCGIICAPKEKTVGDVEFIKEQYRALGKLTTKEKQAFTILGVTLCVWLTQTWHGVDAGMVALVADGAFVACGLITTPDANAKGQWTLAIFIGGVLSVAGLMTPTGAGAWICSLLEPIVSPFLTSPYIFVPFICILTFALRFIIVSGTALLALLVGMLAPLLPGAGIHMFVFVFSNWICTLAWNTSYMSPGATGFIGMTGGKYVTYKETQKASWYYSLTAIVALTASVPLWQMLGLC